MREGGPEVIVNLLGDARAFLCQGGFAFQRRDPAAKFPHGELPPASEQQAHCEGTGGPADPRLFPEWGGKSQLNRLGGFLPSAARSARGNTKGVFPRWQRPILDGAAPTCSDQFGFQP